MTATPVVPVPETNPGPSSALRPRLIAGRFAIKARLGHGRFGEIYEASDIRLNDGVAAADPIAVQIIHSDVLDAEPIRERFRDGFARIRSWAHPNLVRLLELGRDGSTFFATMELLTGSSLRRILTDLSPATVDHEECMAVVCQIGRALSHAHARGMVHGDIRPGNVFVTHDYSVKLLDFAPVPVLPSAVLAEDLAARTVPLAEARDDIYGLACLAYELLTGRHPFGGSLRDEARRAGLEPAPIAGIARRQWRALQHGLTLSGDDPGYTIDDFLDEFGIKGTEKLPVTGPGPDGENADPAVEYEAPPATPAKTGLPGPRGRAQRASLAQQPIYTPRDPSRARPRRGRALRTTLLLVATAGLGFAAYSNYWQWRDAVALWFADVMPLLPAPGDLLRTRPTGQPESETVAPSPIAGVPAEAGLAEAGPTEASAAAEPTTPPESTPQAISSGSAPTAVVPARIASEAVVLEAPPPPATPVGVAFADRTVTVSEAGTAARIAVQRTGDLTRPLTFEWWTTPDSALPDNDYGDLGRRQETFPPGESAMTLYVPIVADNRTETTERFFVNLVREPVVATGRAAPAQVEVFISDDDF